MFWTFCDLCLEPEGIVCCCRMNKACCISHQCVLVFWAFMKLKHIFTFSKQRTYLSEHGTCSRQPQLSLGISGSLQRCPGFEFLLQEWGIAHLEEYVRKGLHTAMGLSMYGAPQSSISSMFFFCWLTRLFWHYPERAAVTYRLFIQAWRGKEI